MQGKFCTCYRLDLKCPLKVHVVKVCSPEQHLGWSSNTKMCQSTVWINTLHQRQSLLLRWLPFYSQYHSSRIFKLTVKLNQYNEHLNILHLCSTSVSSLSCFLSVCIECAQLILQKNMKNSSSNLDISPHFIMHPWNKSIILYQKIINAIYHPKCPKLLQRCIFITFLSYRIQRQSICQVNL